MVEDAKKNLILNEELHGAINWLLIFMVNQVKNPIARKSGLLGFEGRGFLWADVMGDILTSTIAWHNLNN